MRMLRSLVAVVAFAVLSLSAAQARATDAETEFGAPRAMLGATLAMESGRAAHWWALFGRMEIAPQLAQMRECLGAASACVEAGLRMWRADVLASGGDPLALGRAVTARLGYVEDATGHWLGPLAAYRNGGDCEDHAVAKMASLLALGAKSEHVFVVVMRARRAAGRGHAVAALQTDDGWLFLDTNALGVRSAAWLERRYVLERAYRADGAVFRAKAAPMILAYGS